jgi:hypothetical protein
MQAALMGTEGSEIAPLEVSRKILVIRSQRVLLDSDLAALYGVTTRALNQAVRRNFDRFPADFLFQVTDLEAQSLRSQIVILEIGRGRYGKYAPLAFTEHGAIMAATILNSPRAAEMSVYVVRAFVKARELLQSNAELARELTVLKQSVATLDAETRRQFDHVYEAILGLMNPAAKRQ